jgi:hypothetical protein
MQVPDDTHYGSFLTLAVNQRFVVDNDRPAVPLSIIIVGDKCIIGIARIVLSKCLELFIRYTLPHTYCTQKKESGTL